MGASDKIVVNSNFTKSVADQVFSSLTSDLAVIYPCVNAIDSSESQLEGPLWDGKFKIFLSINRFERKKDIALAIRAYQGFSQLERRSTRLILAGGYDNRVTENVQYHNELVQLAESMGLQTATAKTVPTALGTPDNVDVLFLLSVPGSFKSTLLDNAELLLYTPTNEHFGIVPVEAMQHGLPVIASNTGGPLETIVEDKTGWLRDVKKVEQWTMVMRDILNKLGASQKAEMRAASQKRVAEHFSRETMAAKFDAEIVRMTGAPRSQFTGGQDLFMAVGLMGVFLGALLMVIIQARFPARKDPRLSQFARARRSPDSTDADMKLDAYQIL